MHLSKDLIKLHLIVIIWGFTAILGELISKSALILVWYRMIIASACLLMYLLGSGRSILAGKADSLRFLATGFLVAFHWFLFYYCIKISTIPVALVSLSSITLFTSILEPLINKKKFKLLDLVTGLVIITGIACIFHFESRYAEATVIGLTAAAGASLFTVLNSRFAFRADPILISFYEMFGGFLALTLVLLVRKDFTTKNLSLSLHDLGYLILLGTVCTGLAYAVAVAVMRTLSAVSVVLVTSLEPVYGILLSFIFFGFRQHMTSGFYLGALIILLAVFSYPVIKNSMWFRKNSTA